MARRRCTVLISSKEIEIQVHDVTVLKFSLLQDLLIAKRRITSYYDQRLSWPHSCVVGCFRQK